jgi:hypothetical protein
MARRATPLAPGSNLPERRIRARHHPTGNSVVCRLHALVDCFLMAALRRIVRRRAVSEVHQIACRATGKPRVILVLVVELRIPVRAAAFRRQVQN